MLTKDKLHQYYSVDSDGCWLWDGVKAENGYGRFSGTYAHRVSWVLHFGRIPSNLSVLHHCDKPACVNPACLFLGTQKVNLQDMAVKGRHGTSKLTAEKAKLIRALLKAVNPRVSVYKACTVIGKVFGVSRGAIESIRDNRSWTHVM